MFWQSEIMRTITRFIPLLATAAAFLVCSQQNDVAQKASAATPATHTSAKNPVVIELFQSQGCSSCPPANAALNAVADRDDLIALNFSVTYWDRLGWKDTFGDKAYTQRQYDYAGALRNDNVYTPQMVINGARAITGNKPGELNRAIAASTPVSGEPSIKGANGTIAIGSGSGAADIWLVRYDPRIQNVAIRSGENGGRKLPHKNIVRQIDRIGKWNGKAASYTLTQAKNAGWKSVVLVQRQGGGTIISARKI
jgi:hypothetical protein